MERKQTRILVVDDEQGIRELLRDILETEGFAVLTAGDAAEAMAALDEGADMAILDVAMPGDNGYILCRRLRERSSIPVLFLTALIREEDMSQCFASGGDDYLTKPFSRLELVSRVRAMLRRCYEYPVPGGTGAEHTLLIRGDLEVDTAARKVRVKGQPVSLTDTEYQLLELMVRAPGRIFSAQTLYEHVWRQKFTYDDNNIVMVHISKLRKKLGDDSREAIYIKKMWGRGYYVD